MDSGGDGGQSDKLKRRNSSGKGSTWMSSVPIPTSDIPLNNNPNRMMARHPSTLNSSLDSDGTTIDPDISAVPDATNPGLARNSSRAMDRASGRFDQAGSLSMRMFGREEEDEDNDEDDKDEDEEEDEDEDEDGGGGHVRMSLMTLLAETDKQMGMESLAYMMELEDEDEDEDESEAEYNSCCVCMVRHKGTAFVPCGHSFCRLCSRELWVERGNCPLCNNYILEILDIF